jgi:SAM-dependent methyltransferase
MVFVTSAAVLVLEIIAGRLMAPYVGISLDTFTGIIGTMLAGIAVGACLGGWLADRRSSRAMIGPALVAGGALTWLSLPIVDGLGPRVGEGPAAIVGLTTAAFFLPAVVLSAVSPMVAKLRLERLEDTGSVVGGLSAAGTIGALAGTFLTGFVLVAALPSRPIVVAVGAALVVAGFVSWWLLARARPDVATLALVATAGFLGLSTSGPCQLETAYYCVRIDDDAANPTGRTLYLDQLRHAYVDLDDPTNLELRYVRLFEDVTDALAPGPLDALHIGGGGFTFPRYVATVRPGSVNEVLEIDPELVRVAERDLGLVIDDEVRVRVGDGRLALADQPTDSLDLVVGDAFGSQSVPWHLTTVEVAAELERSLRPGGVYVMNVIDGGANAFARAQVATLAERFDHLAVIVPATGLPPGRAVNQVIVASSAPLPRLEVDPADGRVLDDAEVDELTAGARLLTDGHAPVDQLIHR